MPLDPDDIRTPPSPTPADADARAADEASERADQAAQAPAPPARLIDRIDDAAASVDQAPSAGVGGSADAPAPQPLQARLDPPTDPPPGGLEPESGTAAAWMDTAGRFVLELLRTIPERPAGGGARAPQPATRVDGPPAPGIPERPLPGGLDQALAHIAATMDHGLETAGPGYMAYVPGGGLYAAALADLIADVGNRFTGLAMAAPGWVGLEDEVLRWLAGEFGYGPAARGLLLSGSSMANFTALVTSRHHHFGDTGDYAHATIYTSSQAHHSVAKAASMAGIPRANLRRVAVDELYRLDLDDLRRRVEADRHRGLRPFCVVAAAGTTNTGAIDPLPEIAELCAREDLWLHVDAAYGGGFVLCDEGRRRLRGIAAADSLCFDPHKGMFLPYGTGCLLVREGARLAAAHMGEADYLRDVDASALPSPAELGPELSRPFRGLRLWLPLMLHGAAAFREAALEKLALAQLCADGIAARIRAGAPLELVAWPQLSTLAVRLRRREGESLEALDRRNVALLAGINARNRAFLSSTKLPTSEGPAVALRVCVMSFRTHRASVEALLEDLDLALG
ncbi:aminotransferase class V-fold PLP-dependent enzyme [Pseudenhygromyxa sp. WMMC2535]|uniref:pyridoxal phosphate-dependent decarboxylase family protein n=1 Tax=Pseudenhygromyxa sp. WMMC2535 TaxID=2712867 RepID=UPI00155316AA|nr:aminotransferase class V-fold PLP-dependent enzyme [Pseudenhygromyxa sp. WMMC2535]NVB37101.1 aminotransferase class V-fold PLP-dependent enzyme [Pseudenhygromyxa sp. WMMC2535]